jgi:hypothetical protein
MRRVVYPFGRVTRLIWGGAILIVIYYRGAGIVVVLVTLCMMGMAAYLCPVTFTTDPRPLGISFMAAGAVLLPVGISLNRPSKERVPVTDEWIATLFPGQQFHYEVNVPGGQHRLYGLRMEIWAAALLIGGLVLVLV